VLVLEFLISYNGPNLRGMPDGRNIPPFRLSGEAACGSLRNCRGVRKIVPDIEIFLKTYPWFYLFIDHLTTLYLAQNI
jgi:hypothetical protein